MTTTYSVHVEVGSYTWDVTGNDLDNDAAATYGLADPLTITRSWPDSDLQPNVQPSPDEATVNIIAANSSTYPLLTLGDPVAIEFYSQGGFTGPGQTFYGRVASLTAKPHDLGVIYTLSCVDYTVDLQEADPVGTSNYPAEAWNVRMARIMKDARVPDFPAYPPAPLSGWPALSARNKSTATAYDLVLHMLEQLYVDATGVSELGTASVLNRQTRPLLVQRITNRRLDPVPFGLEWLTTGRYIATAAPGRLTNVGGLQTITMSVANSNPAANTPIMDAGNVAIDTTFIQAKGPDSVSRVVVTSDAGTAGTGDVGGFVYTVRYPSEPPTTQVQVTLATEWSTFVPDPLVQMYGRDQNVGRPPLISPWAVRELTWEAWHEAVGWAMPKLGQLLTVARVLATKSPAGREWVSGVVSGFTLAVAGGRPVVTIQLASVRLYEPQDTRRNLGASLGPVSFDSPILGTTTYAQLSTRDSIADYALVRGS